VQIHFPEPCILLRGDKFIVRDTSESVTLGGGEILDAFPLHHRRRPEKLLNYLKDLSKGDLQSFITAEIKKIKNPVSLNQISSLTGISSAKLKSIDFNSFKDDIQLLITDKDTYLIEEKEKEKIHKKIVKSITNYHKRNPLNPKGKTLDELLGLIKIDWASINKEMLGAILNGLEEEKSLKRIENTWAEYNHNVELTDEDKSNINYIEEFIRSSGKHTPLMSELSDASNKKKISDTMLKQMLLLLVSREKIYNIEGNYLHRIIVDEGREKLLKYLIENEKGITVADFRDLIDANRKLCLLLFAQYEKEGLVLRVDDVRVLTESGKKLVETK
jgi:selenocysteine-specific elongation factor